MNDANFRALLEAKRERGELDFDHAQAAAEHFISAIVGFRQMQLAVGVTGTPDEHELDTVVCRVVTMFVRAYGTCE